MSSFGIVQVNQKQGDWKAAKSLMDRIVNWVQPIMKKRGWVVGTFAEKDFSNPGILGMNTGKGHQIDIRLRRNGKEFYESEMLLDTMLHELSHNQHGNHSADFYKTWDELRNELSVAFEKGEQRSGEGKKLDGGQKRNPSTIREGRMRALEAAEKRARLGSTGPQILGGNQILKGLGEAEAVRKSTLKRYNLSDEQCGINGMSDGNKSDDSSSQWICAKCTFENQRVSRKCEICDHQV
jgi:hypothetical protein